MSTWKRCARWASRRPLTLRLADRLGRSRGRLRLLDALNPPAGPRSKPDLTGWEGHDLAACWIGHATVLLRVQGITILTDPVLSNRIGVGLGLVTGGPRRLVAPALTAEELPKVDLILISHAHFDHLDRPTLARLPKRTPVVTAHQTKDLVRDLGYRDVTELHWGDEVEFDNGLMVTAREVAHWGARTFYDMHRGFNAYLIESPGRRVLYGGDTAYFDGFRDIGRVDLAVFGIGGYDPYIAAHANPEQVWEMANHVKAQRILPMHHSTFRLGHEPVNEPIERLLAAAGKDAERVCVREVGGMWAA